MRWIAVGLVIVVLVAAFLYKRHTRRPQDKMYGTRHGGPTRPNDGDDQPRSKF